MRTVVEEKTIYQYSELSDTAKARAREKWQEREGQDFGCFGDLYEPAETAAALLGITFDTTTVQLHGGKTRQEPDIAYSGFWSQGDGASFAGSYEFKPCNLEVRAEFGTDEKLWAIADGLTVLHNRLRLDKALSLSGKVTRDSYSHYVHSGSMDAVVFDAEGEEFGYDEPITKEFLKLMRDFANWIYAGLEEDYNYRTSDEAAEESLNDSDHEFDEDGDMI